MPRPLSIPEIDEFRDRLCGAAAKLFARHGRDGFTLRALANELGISPMTPYRYFRDKDEILAAVRARAFDRFAEALERAFASEGTVSERSARVGEAYVHFAFTEPDSYRLMFEIEQPAEADYPELVRALARARTTMTAHVVGLVEEGLLEGDPVLIGHVYWAALHGAVMLELSGQLTQECDFARLCEVTTRALNRGLAPASAASASSARR